MDKNLRVLAIAILVTFAVLLLVVIFSSGDERTEPTINDNVVAFTNFDITDAATGSSCEGTVIVSYEDSFIVKILTKLDKQPGDFGGFCFISDPELIPVSVNTNFNESAPFNGVYIIKGGLYGEGGSVEIGREFYGTPSKEHVEGFAEIVFRSEQHVDLSDITSFRLTIGVGSEITEDGFRALYPTMETLVVDVR